MVKRILMAVCATLLIALSTFEIKPQGIKGKFLVTLKADIAPCSFQLTDQYDGGLRSYPYPVNPISTANYEADLHRKTLPGAINVEFTCYVKESKIKAPCPEDEPDDVEGENGKFFTLKTKNAEGPAAFYSDTTGDEGNRFRHLSFCLFTPNGNILRGSTFVDAVYDSPRAKHKSIELEVMKLLQSIEFIDASTRSSATSSSSSKP